MRQKYIVHALAYLNKTQNTQSYIAVTYKTQHTNHASSTGSIQTSGPGSLSVGATTAIVNAGIIGFIVAIMGTIFVICLVRRVKSKRQQDIQTSRITSDATAIELQGTLPQASAPAPALQVKTHEPPPSYTTEQQPYQYPVPYPKGEAYEVPLYPQYPGYPQYPAPPYPGDQAAAYQQQYYSDNVYY